MTNWLRRANRSVTENSTTILSSLAVAGVVATAALAVRATPAAMEKIRKLRDDKAAEAGPLLEDQDTARNDTPPVLDVIKVTWRDFLPAGLVGTATIMCIVGSNKIGLRRSAALMSAYSLAETAFSQYKDEVLEQLGKNKEQKIRDGVAAKNVDRNPVNEQDVVVTAGGDQLCYESLTGRYFLSDMETIRRAENDLKQHILLNMFADHNELYSLLGLEPVTIGDALGWNIEHMPEFSFTSHISADGRPTIVLGYVLLPKVDYLKF